MSTFVGMDGNTAVAEAMRQINPDVMAAYPITPQTSIVQTFSNFVADGLVDTEFVTVESEHSAMSACVGAAGAGARVMTATAANGLALMWEIVYIAASLRLPIVMPVANRALSGPINIHCDHSDSMGARDSSWIQIYGENPQESYDNTIQAVRIAEHESVLLPVMAMHDGFITGHGLERLEILDDPEVKTFIGEKKVEYSLLDIDNPVTYGPLDFYDFYYEHKRQQVEAMANAPQVILEVGKEYGKRFGREYGLFETYRLDDAELAIVVMSSTAGTARMAIDGLRNEGLKIGLLKPRVFRPFVAEAYVEALKDKAAVAVMDRSISFGAMGGPLYLEFCAAFHQLGGPSLVKNHIFGLGGRDIQPQEIEGVGRGLAKAAESGVIKERVEYLGVRE